MPTQSIVNCLICYDNITNPDYRVVLCQEEYPDIEIGPYCESCFNKIKICSGCQRPFFNTEVVHTGDGDHYCSTCAEGFSKCDICNSITSEALLEDINGEKVCKRCKTAHFFTCNCCNSVKKVETEVLFNSLEGLERSGIFRKYKRICTDCFEKKKSFFKKYIVKTCQSCGNYYKLHKSYDNETYCEDCWNSFRTCSICGIKEPDIRNFDVDGYTKSICNRCLHSKVNICASCGTYTAYDLVEKKSIFKIQKVCRKCASKISCDTCGTFFIPKKEQTTCDNCLSLYKNNKCDCGLIRDHNWNCRVCGETQIYEYSRKPHLFFNISKEENVGSVVLFGLENEVSFSTGKIRDRALRELYTAYDPSVLLAKSDGSIPGPGFEIVTQPMSLKFFNQMNLLPLVPKGAQATSSCGLHIHVNRSAFISDLHIYKVINFLNSNRSFSEFVAGRSFNDYAMSVKKKVTKFVKDAKMRSSERRSIVNLLNKNTIEFRLYCGCTQEEELRSRVEFTLGLIEFCKDESYSKISIENLVEFFKNNKVKYPNGFKVVSSYEA